MKPVVFVGDSLSRIREFPETRETSKRAWNCDRSSADLNHRTWKPISSVGSGVREIRVREAAGAFRVLYVANLADAVVRPTRLPEEDPGHGET